MFGEVFGTLALGTYQEKKCLCPCISGGGWDGMMGRGVVREEWGRLEGLSCSTGDACSRWFHICSSWYLPGFLFNVGSCTWMNMDSLMVLE